MFNWLHKRLGEPVTDTDRLQPTQPAASHTLNVDPDRDDDLLELLRPRLRPALVGATTPLISGDALRPTESRFGGEPYAEAGQTWPINEYNGRPLDFVCQVWLDDPAALGLPAELRLFTYFCDWEESADVDQMVEGGGQVLHCYSAPADDKATKLMRPPPPDEYAYVVKPCGLDLSLVQTLPDRSGALSGNEERDPLSRWLWASRSKHGLELQWTEAVKALTGHDQAEPWPPIQIGGYPRWIQDADPLGDGILCQVNANDSTGASWGDWGSAYIYVTGGLVGTCVVQSS